MKTLSIRQPWAELILQGRRTLELRTWRTNYRGLIAIHAAQEIKKEACERYGIDADSLPRGQIVGTVEIVDVVDFDAESFDAARSEHLALGAWPGDLLGWRLTNPRRLPEPIPARGKQNLFEIPDDLLSLAEVHSEPRQEKPKATTRRVVEHSRNGDCPFELRLQPASGDPPYSLTLYQWPIKSTDENSNGGENGKHKPSEITRLEGAPLRLVSDLLLEALRRSGYKPTDLAATRRAPFHLDEETGIRLALLFLTIRPLTRLDRIDKIIDGLRAMPSEEAYYWYSKTTAPASAVNAQRALRILLAEE